MNRVIKWVFLICAVLGARFTYADHGAGGTVSMSLNSSNSSLTLKKKQWLVESLSEYRSYSSFASDQLLEIEHDDYTVVEKNKLLFGSLKVSYGLTDKVSLTLQQAYFMSSSGIIGLHDHGGVHSSSDWLLGDLTMLNNYMFYQNKDKKIGFSVILGVEIPISENAYKEGAALLVVSSGSFDPIFGAMIQKKWNKSTFTSNVIYKMTTPSNSGIDYGDYAGVEFTYVSRIGKTLTDSTYMPKLGCSLIGSIGGELLQPQKQEHDEVNHTGYSQATLGVGLLLSVKKKINIPISLKVPIYQKINGYQNRMNIGLNFAVTFLLN